MADFEPRRIFCQRMLQQCAVFVNFLACILFTDEAGFTRDGIFNFIAVITGHLKTLMKYDLTNINRGSVSTFGVESFRA